MFAAREIELNKYKGVSLESASPFGRGFGRVGGLTDAVIEVLKETKNTDFKFKPLICNGMKECIKAIEKLSLNDLDANFIEGMACEGGCVCGPGSLNHNAALGKSLIKSHADSAQIKSIDSSIEFSDGSTIIQSKFPKK